MGRSIVIFRGLQQVSEAVKSALATVVAGDRLTTAETERAIGSVLDGEATPAQLAGLLIALRMRGETVEELLGFVRAMRARVLVVDAPEGTIDTCGTGGDVHHTFNISTATAIVTAAAGVPIAKHGNRAVSSLSGSSDAMAALGLRIDSTPEEASRALHEDGFAYLHAPDFHPGMRHAGPVRRELAVRTAFNLCGPLANPAFPKRQLLGVGDPGAARHVAEVLHALGVERAFVVHGDRVDELPLDGSGVIYDVTPDGIARRTVTAEDAGLPRADTSTLVGGMPDQNAALIVSILQGREVGPPRDVVALNAGAALVAAGRAGDLREGVEQALALIASGAAHDRLERLRLRSSATEGAA
jgi:anthranilate phosphoribosyltransferase